MTTVPEWLDVHLDRVLTDQRARIASAQVVATFAVAIAGGFLASAMHAHPDAALGWATAAFALSFVAGSGTFLLDRSTVPDVGSVLQDQTLGSSDRLDQLRVSAHTSVRLNASSVKAVQQSRNLSMFVASASIALSLLGMMR